MLYCVLFFVICCVLIASRIVRSSHTIRAKTVDSVHGEYLVNHEFNYVFGLPGTGKSTLLAAVAQSCYLQGIPCFSSFPINHAYKFQGFDKQYPTGSVFLFDEIYDMVGCGTNRGIPENNVTMFFKEFRHSRYTIWACSQEADDVARRVRGVVTRAYALKLNGNSTILRQAEIKEVKNLEGEKYELTVSSPIVGYYSDYVLYRPDFYDDFDSYCRRYYSVSAKFESWN